MRSFYDSSPFIARSDIMSIIPIKDDIYLFDDGECNEVDVF